MDYDKIWVIYKNGIEEYRLQAKYENLQEARIGVEKMNEVYRVDNKYCFQQNVFYILQCDTTSDYLNHFDYEHAFDKIESEIK